MKVNVIKDQQFVCKALPGISFSFPVFKNWEPKTIEEKQDGCVIHLNWPDTIEYETPRRISVRKVDLDMGEVVCFSKSKNNNGVLYGYAFDPSLYVEGFKPVEGRWDYLHFYLVDYVIRIEIDAGNEDSGFSVKQFTEKVTSTLSADIF